MARDPTNEKFSLEGKFADLNLALEDQEEELFEVTPSNGFLPKKHPLACLPSPF